MGVFQALLELLLLFLLVGAMVDIPGVAGAASALPSGCTPHFSLRTAVSGAPPSENLPALTDGYRMEENHPFILSVVFH